MALSTGVRMLFLHQQVLIQCKKPPQDMESRADWKDFPMQGARCSLYLSHEEKNTWSLVGLLTQHHFPVEKSLQISKEAVIIVVCNSSPSLTQFEVVGAESAHLVTVMECSLSLAGPVKPPVRPSFKICFYWTLQWSAVGILNHMIAQL